MIHSTTPILNLSAEHIKILAFLNGILCDESREEVMQDLTIERMRQVMAHFVAMQLIPFGEASLIVECYKQALNIVEEQKQ